MSDCRVSSSTSSVLPSARSAIDTPRLMASVVAPRPPLAAKTEVIRPGFRGSAEPRNRASFSSAATRSTRSTGRRRNSRAPARRTRMTSSAETPCPVARIAVSGSLRASCSIAVTAGAAAGDSSASTSTTRRSGRVAAACKRASARPLYSPTSVIVGISTSTCRVAARAPASESTSTARSAEGAITGRPVARGCSFRRGGRPPHRHPGSPAAA